MARIAFLGAGLLGSGMVRRFLKSGAQVTVWNRTAAKARALEADGAKAAATPQEAAQGADHVHIIVSDDKETRERVARVLIPRLREEHIRCRRSKGELPQSCPGRA